MNKPFISRPTICPKCGGKIVEIIYGEPSIELFEAHERGEIILGGCCMVVDDKGNQLDPKYGCVDCEYRSYTDTTHENFI